MFGHKVSFMFRELGTCGRAARTASLQTGETPRSLLQLPTTWKPTQPLPALYPQSNERLHATCVAGVGVCMPRQWLREAALPRISASCASSSLLPCPLPTVRFSLSSNSHTHDPSFLHTLCKTGYVLVRPQHGEQRCCICTATSSSHERGGFGRCPSPFDDHHHHHHDQRRKRRPLLPSRRLSSWFPPPPPPPGRRLVSGHALTGWDCD